MFVGVNKYFQTSFCIRALPWIILAIAAMNVIMVGGKRRSFGIFIASLSQSYNQTSMTELDWIGDSYAALAFFIMPFVTSVIVNFNRAYQRAMLMAGFVIFVSCMSSSVVPSPGYMFITHTILHGVGSSLILCTTALITGEYFDKKHRFHVLATTFVSGGPYGVLIFGPMYAYLVKHEGWRMAFRIVAAPFAILCILAAIFFIPRHNEYETLEENNESKPKKKGLQFCSWDHIKNNPQIMLWCADRILNNIVMYGLMMNLTAFLADELNKSGESAFSLNYAMGIGESFIFTVGAITGDRLRGFLPFVQLVGAFGSTVILYAVYYNLTRLGILKILIGISGSAIGIANTALYATTEEIFLLHGTMSYPMTKMFGGVGMIIAPLFSGLIIDLFQYRGFFACQVIFAFMRSILLIIINTILMRKRQYKIRELMTEQVEMHQNAARTDWNRVGEDGFPVNEFPVVSNNLYQDAGDMNEKVA